MPYPDAAKDIERLVQDHHETLDADGQPLVLAVYYHSTVAPDDECLFEVAQNFGGNEVSGVGEMMQVEFGPTSRHPLGGHSLRLTLTSPKEFEYALRKSWTEVQDIVDAAKRKQAKVIFRKDNDISASSIVDTLGLVGTM